MKVLRKIKETIQAFFVFLLLLLGIYLQLLSIPFLYLAYLQYKKKYGYDGSFREWVEDFLGGLL